MWNAWVIVECRWHQGNAGQLERAVGTWSSSVVHTDNSVFGIIVQEKLDKLRLAEKNKN